MAFQDIWNLDLERTVDFFHYGMTEMGYGGALACGAHDGYHLREADLLFEIVDPVTHEPIGRGGRPGEIVFATLTRYTMPWCDTGPHIDRERHGVHRTNGQTQNCRAKGLIDRHMHITEVAQ